MAFADQGYTGEQPAGDAAERDIRLEVAKLPEAKRGFVLLHRRWVVERRLTWMTRFRRLTYDDEWRIEKIKWLNLLAFSTLMARYA